MNYWKQGRGGGGEDYLVVFWRRLGLILCLPVGCREYQLVYLPLLSSQGVAYLAIHHIL